MTKIMVPLVWLTFMLNACGYTKVQWEDYCKDNEHPACKPAVVTVVDGGVNIEGNFVTLEE